MTDTLGRLTAALSDRYRIERELGQGGMATVYLAQDLRHDRKVAIKVLRPELAAVIGAERFLSEIKTTANLQHPHILPLFDSGAADSFLFYVMPFIEGESLRDRLNREKQLPITDAVRISTEVASALDYAHRHSVIHRDIKPENILLHDGRALVADFGIALAASKAGGSRMTETGMSLGTPTYMSPEQAMGEREITARSDVYALGCVTYEMLVGDPPFLGGTAQAIVAKVMTEKPAPPSRMRDTVPPEVEDAVLTALAKLPADRQASAAQFAAALSNSSLPPRGTGTTVGRRPVGASSRLVFGTAALAVAMLLVALIVWLRPTPPPPIRRISVALPVGQALGSPSDFRLALSPDGDRMIYLGAGPAPGQPGHLWLRSWSELKAAPLAGTDGAFNPSFSPDGDRVAFVAGTPRAIRVISLAGGPPVILTDSLVDRGGLAWGNDGYIYYDGHFDGDGIARIRESGGVPEQVTVPDTAAGEIFHVAPSTLPGNKGLLFTVVRRGAILSDNQVAVFDFKAQRHVALVRGVMARFDGAGRLLYVTSDGTLMAAPFDEQRLVLTGKGVAVGEQVSIRGNSRVDLGVGANGVLVYAAGAGISGNWELVWVDRNGVAMPVDSNWSGYLGRPRLSPDGSKVAIPRLDGASFTVWVKQLDHGPASKLTGEAARDPVWSPDGGTISFVSTAADAIWSGPADGSVLPVRYRSESGRMGDLEYSPDGVWLVYRSISDLYAIRVHGDTTRHDLVTGPATEAFPTVSPDGQWLAYGSDESGRFEVYVRPFPETQKAKRQVSVAGGSEPRWSHNGRELFFVDARNALVTVPVGSGPAFTSGAVSTLFSVEQYVRNGGFLWYDVTPDSRRFLMARPVGVSRPNLDELILVESYARNLDIKGTK